MTKEELEKKAEESYWTSITSGGMSSKKCYTLGFIDGVKEMEKENERLKQEYEQLKQKLDWFLTETVAGKEYRPKEELEELQRENAKLKAQIEKMKNHENCKHHSQYSRMHTIYADDKIVCYKCKNCSLWELEE